MKEYQQDWELSDELQDAIRHIEEYTRDKILIYSLASFAFGIIVTCLVVTFIFGGF